MEPTPSQLNQLKIQIIFKIKLFFEFNQEQFSIPKLISTLKNIS